MKNRLIAIFISIILLVTLGAGCQNNKGQETESEKYTGTHVFTAIETDKFLVQNGATQYKIVVPYDASSEIAKAKDELITFFKQATGIKLALVQEDQIGLTHSAEAKYISLGETKLFESSGLTVDKKALGSDGVRIITKDNSIYLVGGSDIGTLYAVYDFLELLFNFDVFYTDCIYIDEGVRDVKLYNYDVTDIPDIDIRCGAWGWVGNGVNTINYRFRQPYALDYLMPVGDVENGQNTVPIHNTQELLPKDAPTNNPDWQATIGDNLCYTARGNKASYDAMVERLAEVITNCMTIFDPVKCPNYNAVTITMEDFNDQLCTCSACSASRQKYGTDSAAVMILCNRVMEKIEEWMNQPENSEYKRENFKLFFFAYRSFADAPSHYDKQSDKYVLNSSDLELRDDVGVFMALDSTFITQIGFNDTRNDQAKQKALSWLDVVPTAYLWTYSTNFGGYLDMMDSFNFFTSDAYTFFAENNVKLWYNQGDYENNQATSFQTLKAYLDAKLQWNCTLNEGELIDKWFDAMYKDASVVMRNLFNKEREHMFNILEKKGLNDKFSFIYSVAEVENWNINMLREWINDCKTARSIVKEKYEHINPDLYKMLKEHIDLESIYPYYYTLTLFSDILYKNEKAEYKSELLDIVTTLGDIKIKEHDIKTIKSVISNI